MEPLVYVLAILGCADGGQLCEPVSQAPGRFESKAACMAYASANLPSYTDLPYPVIAGRCETQGLQTVAKRERPRG